MIIIPARLASSRFPKKVLADIDGLPMIVRTAQRVSGLDDVIVAAEDEEIIEVCKAYHINAHLTSPTHKSGTDRINECAQLLGLNEETIVINLQADEPFIEKEVISALQQRLNLLKATNTPFIMGSCYNLINKEASTDPNLVKVVLDDAENAIYFSRSQIPYARGENATYFGHIGIYGFMRRSLREFCSLGYAPLEDIEKLEQLRAVYHGKKISMVKVSSTGFGIDTPEDLQRAKEIFL